MEKSADLSQKYPSVVLISVNKQNCSLKVNITSDQAKFRVGEVISGIMNFKLIFHFKCRLNEPKPYWFLFKRLAHS